MGLFGKKDKGIIQVINYEGGNETLIYKHPKTDFNLGSQLVVHESQEAIFFKDGKALDTFGPGRHTLQTANLPILRDLISLVAGGENVFTAAVYFVNLTTELGIKWGTDTKIRMFDPVSGLHLELGACGTFNLKVVDGRKLLVKVVGTASGFDQQEIFGSVGVTTDSALGKFKGMIVSKIKANLPKAIRENDINILEVDEHIDELSEILRTEINEILDEYGLVLPEFFITTIQTPDDDPNFARMKQQHADRYLKVQEQRIREAEARAAKGAVEAEAEVKIAEARGEALAGAEGIKIEGAAKAEAYRAQAAAEAEEMRMKGYTYQEETARQVGVAAAGNEGGGGGGSIVSDVVKAGVGLGVGVAVAGQVVETVKPAVTGIVGAANNGTPNPGSAPAPASEAGWVCPACGHPGNKGKFCEECGYKKPEETWTCPECGQTGLKGKFCPNCGHKRGE